MQKVSNILYLHGMGGGADSRIPRILREYFAPEGIGVICHTYSFDPEIAVSQIATWVGESAPALVIGESLGSIHAIRLRGIPHILVSPALGGPRRLAQMAPLMHLGLCRLWARRKWLVKPGDRQELIWKPKVLKKYRAHIEAALENAPSSGSGDYFHAFIGDNDHYRRSRVVDLDAWKKHFGPDSFTTYPGSHFMEEEYIHSLLIPKIEEILYSKRSLT